MKRVMLVVLLAVVVMGCTQCATLMNSAKSGELSTQIAYYDSYVEGAAKWLSYAALIPGVGVYLSSAGVALAAVDNALDNLKLVADSYKEGSPPAAQVDAIAVVVKRAIDDYNAVIGSLPEAVKEKANLE